MSLTEIPDEMPPPAPKRPAEGPPPRQEPETLQTALASLLNDSSLSDVTLVSRDGVNHHAVRALLASRSAYFRNLLYGTFQEARQDVIKLHLPSSTIQDVLSYIYTDNCPSLMYFAPGEAKRMRLDSSESCRQLSELLIAADYLVIPSLFDAANQALRRLLLVNRANACTALQMIPTTLAAYELARNIVRQSPSQALGVLDDHQGTPSHGSVGILSAERFAAVLNDRDIFASDTYLFKVLKFWCSYRESEGRKEKAVELARHINLERCKPSFLRNVVRPSGLVPEDRLTSTFEQQALEAERGRALYDNFRGGSVFADGTKFLHGVARRFRNQTLGPWISGGRHEWIFRIHRKSDCLWLGLASAMPSNNWMFFTERKGWAYSIDGHVRPIQKGSQGHMLRGPELGLDCEVRMVLNLRRSGSVSFFLNESRQVFTAFRGLKKMAKEFIVAVCIGTPAKIELVKEVHHIE